MRRRPAGLSLAQQAFALRARYPGAALTLGRQQLRWVGRLTPSDLSREYLVELTYRLGRIAEVRVLNPTLDPGLTESLPHVYTDDILCLHVAGDWHAFRLLSETIVPWASEWLLFYEIWKATGDWHGGGAWPPDRPSDCSPSAHQEQEDVGELANDGSPAADA